MTYVPESVPERIFIEKVNFPKSADDNESMKNYPAYKGCYMTASKQRYLDSNVCHSESVPERILFFN